MNINSNATSAIVDSLFRLVRDGLVLRGAVGAWHRGAAGATGKQTALYGFGSLSRCFSVLCADRSVCVAPMHLEQARIWVYLTTSHCSSSQPILPSGNG